MVDKNCLIPKRQLIISPRNKHDKFKQYNKFVLLLHENGFVIKITLILYKGIVL